MGPRGEETREAIVRAAVRLYVNSGGTSSSLESVANSAGVTRTAVYYYFPSKSDLVREVITRLDWDWWSTVVGEAKGRPSFRSGLRVLLTRLVTQSAERNGSIYFALVDAARDDSEVREGLRSQLWAVRASIREMVIAYDDLAEVTGGRDIEDVVDAVLGLVWCLSAGVSTTSNRAVAKQVASAIDLICRD